MTNKRILFSATLLLMVALLSACAGSRSGIQDTGDEELVWPLPPEPPKIRFEKSIHSELDVGRKRSLAQKIYEAIFGRAPAKALKKPIMVHAAQDGRILVTDSGWRKVLAFNFANKTLDVIGKGGRGRLRNPLGVTTDVDGLIYVTDAGGQRVMVYRPDGKFIRAFGGKDVFVRPSGIVVNSDENKIYVVDTWGHQIKVFDRQTNRFLFTIGKQGEKPEGELPEGVLDKSWNRGDGECEFRFPTQVALGPDGRLYIVDTLNFRIQIISPDGEFISAFGEVGNTPGSFYRPKGVSLDSDGHVYVTDAAFSNIQIFEQTGKLLLNVGSFGSGKADMRLPAGLFINSLDQIYVVDQFNNRIQVYQYLGDEPYTSEPLTDKEGR